MDKLDLEQIEYELEHESLFDPVVTFTASDFKLNKTEVALVEEEEEEEDTRSTEQKVFDSVLEEDFDTARANIKFLIKEGKSVLKSMISLAKNSDHPRAYEVVGTLMKTMLEANKDLMDIHERKQKGIPKGTQVAAPAAEGPQTVENHLYVGSTAELQKFLEERKK